MNTDPDWSTTWTAARCHPIVYARAGMGDPQMARCERCGQREPLSMHHRHKRGQGGTWAPSNIVVVCGDGTTGCHGWIEHNATNANAEGWHLRPHDPDGSKVPLRVHNVPWCRVKLDDAGGMTLVD